MGTRFSVDAELSSSTLTVNEGKVRATRLSDGSSVEVTAKHRVVAALDCELVPEEMPESVYPLAKAIWKTEENVIMANGCRAHGPVPAHLKTVPYTLPAKDDRKQRTIHTLSMPVSSGDHPPVVLQPESKVRVRAKIASSHPIWFGMTLRRGNGDFAAAFRSLFPPKNSRAENLSRSS